MHVRMAGIVCAVVVLVSGGLAAGQEAPVAIGWRGNSLNSGRHIGLHEKPLS